MGLVMIPVQLLALALKCFVLKLHPAQVPGARCADCLHDGDGGTRNGGVLEVRR